MSEQHTEQTAEQGTESVNGQERPAHLTPFSTLDEAKQVATPSKNFRVFSVTDQKSHKVWAWGQSADNAIVIAAKAVGWKAEVAEPKTAKVDPADVVAGLSEEQLTEMLAARGLVVKKGKSK